MHLLQSRDSFAERWQGLLFEAGWTDAVMFERVQGHPHLYGIVGPGARSFDEATYERAFVAACHTETFAPRSPAGLERRANVAALAPVTLRGRASSRGGAVAGPEVPASGQESDA